MLKTLTFNIYVLISIVVTTSKLVYKFGLPSWPSCPNTNFGGEGVCCSKYRFGAKVGLKSHPNYNRGLLYELYRLLKMMLVMKLCIFKSKNSQNRHFCSPNNHQYDSHLVSHILEGPHQLSLANPSINMLSKYTCQSVVHIREKQMLNAYLSKHLICHTYLLLMLMSMGHLHLHSSMQVRPGM